MTAPLYSPPQVKLFIAVLVSPAVEQDGIVSMLAEVFGSADYIGSRHPFDVTTYYDDEMGTGLQRFLVGFRGPHLADILAPGKRACIELEKGLAVESKRTVNLDLGYLDHHKVVLASTKGAGQKIYVGDGIYADLIARYKGGAYQPFEWSFPDFRDGRYSDELSSLRKIHLESITTSD